MPHAIESFLRQDYPDRELIVLDDTGQYPASIQGNRWQIISLARRFRTLGEKRNAAAALASSDADILAVWDDDDIYLPWHLSAAVMALADHAVAIPSICWTANERGLSQTVTNGLFHSGWSYRRAALDLVFGYPFQNNGEDQELAVRFRSAGLRFADPCQNERPSLVYRWQTDSYHLSQMADDGYEQLANNGLSAYCPKIYPHWDRDWTADVLRLTPQSG